ncbi:hypothetical protein GCM10010207_64550 [Streptomyces atratus]|uniref:hypothetical protein n=1 Tax=Streptomyces atratus TaxID=1893 RepID=UPI001670DBE1|nr:hypothetical protein [Streptomyces atratus]GGT55615.1 hypothetical protein GCM10010207_64550 [Streptomyces atratus]
MLSEALTALTAAGGAAVVQAAGTDTWAGVRAAVARLLAQGDPERERHQLRRLDRTANAVTTEGGALQRSLQAAAWQADLAEFLEPLEGVERERAITALQALAEQPSALGRGGDTVTGNTCTGWAVPAPPRSAAKRAWVEGKAARFAQARG